MAEAKSDNGCCRNKVVVNCMSYSGFETRTDNAAIRNAVYGRLFQDLLHIQAHMTQPFVNSVQNGLRSRAKLDWLFVNNRHPLAAMGLQQFGQQPIEGCSIALEFSVVRDRGRWLALDEALVFGIRNDGRHRLTIAANNDRFPADGLVIGVDDIGRADFLDPWLCHGKSPIGC